MPSVRKLVLVLAVIGVLAVAGSVLAATQSFSGNIASGVQTDTYSMYYQDGQAVTGDLRCDDTAMLDTVLSLYDDTNQLVAYNDDGGPKSCGGFHSSLLSYNIGKSGVYTWHVDGFGSSTGGYTLQIIDGVAGFVPSDDRINPHAFAPVAVYCRAGNAVEVWNIDSAGHGTPLFSVSGADVTAGANGAALGGAGSASLSKLADGRLQVSATMLDGKTYLFIFNGCPVSASETYTVENGNAVLFETRK